MLQSCNRSEFFRVVYVAAGFVWRVDVEPVESVLATICIAYQYLKNCCNNTRNERVQEKCLKHFMIRIEEVLPFILRTNIGEMTQSII